MIGHVVKKHLNSQPIDRAPPTKLLQHPPDCFKRCLIFWVGDRVKPLEKSGYKMKGIRIEFTGLFSFASTIEAADPFEPFTFRSSAEQPDPVWVPAVSSGQVLD
jgi:hypothetical protein